MELIHLIQDEVQSALNNKQAGALFGTMAANKIPMVFCVVGVGTRKAALDGKTISRMTDGQTFEHSACYDAEFINYTYRVCGLEVVAAEFQYIENYMFRGRTCCGVMLKREAYAQLDEQTKYEMGRSLVNIALANSKTVQDYIFLVD